MFIKIFAGVLLICAGTLAGYHIGGTYKKRAAFFSGLHSFILLLRAEISYAKKSLPQIIEEFDSKTIFNECLTEYRNNIECPDNINFEKFRFLKADEKRLIANFFSYLGRSDSLSQIENINAMAASVEEILSDAKAQEKKHLALYGKLGFFAGAALFILII